VPRLALAVALILCAAVAAAQNPAVDVLHYRIGVGVPAEGEEIDARVELTVMPVAKPLATLDLDFIGYTIDEVTVDGQPAPFTREHGQLRIATGGKSETFRASVRYHGKPSDGLIIRANKYGRRGVFADNWPNRAHLWFPSVDHPSDKATVEFIIDAPPAYEVIANGLRVGTATLPDGRKQTHWSESMPIPVHCMVFGAGGLSVVGVGSVEDTEITYYLDPEDRDAGVRQLGRTRQMVRIFSTMFGPFPYEKLALVESSTRYGGMENATAIFLDEKKIGGNVSLEPLVAHEIAHQWFGDAVTQNEWSDVWLSEGFASYFEAVFFERADGREAFLAHMRGEREIYLKANREKPRPVYDRPAELMQLLSAFTYEKGAWVLHMLRGVMGDGPFFAAVHEYYMRHRNGNASTADLRAIMERHAGQPLGWFFKQWIFEAGHPLYAFAWKWDAGKVAVTIEQRQTGALFRMPVVVEVRGNARVQRETVLVDERREEIEFASVEAPTSVVMDPDEVILKEMVTAEER